jgi:hypothetical protein
MSLSLILGTMAVPMGSTFAKAQYMYQPVTRQDKNFQSWKQWVNSSPCWDTHHRLRRIMLVSVLWWVQQTWSVRLSDTKDLRYKRPGGKISDQCGYPLRIVHVYDLMHIFYEINRLCYISKSRSEICWRLWLPIQWSLWTGHVLSWVFFQVGRNISLWTEAKLLDAKS